MSSSTFASDAHEAKIAFFDIETSPNLVYTWGIWEQNVVRVVKDWTIIAFAVKYLGQKGVRTYTLADFPGYKKDKESDFQLVMKLWEEFNNADILVAHNGDRFDIKKANTRFMIHGLPVPAPYKTLDTKKMAKSQAAFDSNKLDELARQLELPRKVDNGGFWLWEACMAGDRKAWDKMKKYNAQDVVVLEKLYLKLRPWSKNHPSVTIYSGVPDACPRCSSARIQRRGYMYTSTSKSPKYECQDCGAWGTAAGSKTGVTIK